MITQEQIEQAAKIIINAPSETEWLEEALMRNAFISGAQWALEQDQWVDVDDRLPLDKGEYIIYNPEVNEVYCCLYSHIKKQFTDHNGSIISVSHWQSLPQKPKL